MTLGKSIGRTLHFYFENRQIRVKAINAKWNKSRAIPMTQRVYEELLKLKKEHGDH